MCIMSTPKPKVEKVAPAPQQITSDETAAVNDRISKDNKKRRAMAGAQQMQSEERQAEFNTGGKQLLG